MQIIDLDELRLGDELFLRDHAPGDLPDTSGWMHSGCAITNDGTVVVAHPEGRQLILMHPDETQDIIPVPVLEMHTIRHDVWEGEETLWLVNNGHRFVKASPDYDHYRERGSVIRVKLDGTVVQELQCPDIAEYAETHWQPTSLARTEDGSIWVADGYELSLLHLFSADGTYLKTVDGSETGTVFDCNHGITMRGSELLVADRSNRRIVVLADGTAPRILEAPLTSPSSILVRGDWLVVTELFGGLALFHQDQYVGHFARDTDDPARDAWPNERDNHGDMRRPTLGPVLHSPHGIAADENRIVVTEWSIHGRVSQYSKTSSDLL